MEQSLAELYRKINCSIDSELYIFTEPTDKKLYCVEYSEIANNKSYSYDNHTNTFVNKWVPEKTVINLDPATVDKINSFIGFEDGEIRVSANMPTIFPGTLEKDKNHVYRFEKLLGQGTFGQVWKAKDEKNREVAIKVFIGGTAIASFDKEKQCLQTINPKCGKAVCLENAYINAGVPRIVMSYIEGSDLEKVINNESLPRRQGDKNIINDLILGLDTFHRMGVYHQDIKEANIYRENSGHFRYIDWGGCCYFGMNCGYLGTPYTVSPELGKLYDTYKNIQNQLNNNTNDSTLKNKLNSIDIQIKNQSNDMKKAHDIWSLGVSLLGWYTLDKFYDNYYPLYYNISENKQLHDYIDKAKLAKPIKDILKNLLEYDMMKRIQNFDSIVGLYASGGGGKPPGGGGGKPGKPPGRGGKPPGGGGKPPRFEAPPEYPIYPPLPPVVPASKLRIPEQQRLEQQRLEQQRLEQQRLEQQRLEQQRQKDLEQQRLEQQRQRTDQEILHLESERRKQMEYEQKLADERKKKYLEAEQQKKRDIVEQYRRNLEKLDYPMKDISPVPVLSPMQISPPPVFQPHPIAGSILRQRYESPPESPSNDGDYISWDRLQ
jgi:serine/threonine protein kinase